MTRFPGLRVKTHSYLIDYGSDHKKTKDTKKCVIERKLKIGNYKNCLEATQLKNEIKYLEKSKLTKFIRNDKSKLKTQQELKSESHNAFTEKLIRLLSVQLMIKECNQLI